MLEYYQIHNFSIQILQYVYFMLYPSYHCYIFTYVVNIVSWGAGLAHCNEQATICRIAKGCGRMSSAFLSVFTVYIKKKAIKGPQKILKINKIF